MSTWEGKKIATTTATTNSKIEPKKTINTSYTKSYQKKSAPNQHKMNRNYFVKERKMLMQANCIRRRRRRRRNYCVKKNHQVQNFFYVL
jgi:hypothetical protein